MWAWKQIWGKAQGAYLAVWKHLCSCLFKLTLFFSELYFIICGGKTTALRNRQRLCAKCSTCSSDKRKEVDAFYEFGKFYILQSDKDRLTSDSIIASTGIMRGSCWNCGMAIQVKYTANILYRTYVLRYGSTFSLLQIKQTKKWLYKHACVCKFNKYYLLFNYNLIHHY